MQYYYGRDRQRGGYIVENAADPSDYWSLERKGDLVTFLMNLPQSAERDYMSTVYPDWDKLTDAQRVAYLEEDGARFREIARQRLVLD
jgi:hypothetical protein